jgi:hypothetical protein
MSSNKSKTILQYFAHKLICVGVLAWIGIDAVYAQQNPLMRFKNIVITNDTIQLDTLPIAFGSLQITGYTEGKHYKIQYGSSFFVNLNIPLGKSVQVHYQVMALPINERIQNKSTNIIRPEFVEIRNPFLYTPNMSNSELFNREGLRMNGNLSRGLAIGNNQDVVVNSNLNLQLAGKLGNEIDVLAAISDENNPIQPEGNTQQLQDFDRVFIQLSKEKTHVIVGDFEMLKPEHAYFMNYFKKSRGMQVEHTELLGNKTKLNVQANGAISRGRFNRNVINGIEGNQGPYRLTGNNGENFIIIISGTEAVYLDGELLTRGEQYDYIIDYNAGEVTFTPKKIITQFSRIVVEFQFADRNYARSLFQLHTSIEQKKFRLYTNYFTEQDNKNQPFLQNLTDSNKATLASVGDRLNEALAPSSVATNVFSANRIMYKQIDTVGFSGVYVHATSPDEDTVFYELRFSYVGQGNGNYTLSPSSANGRVFQWLAPVGGVLQGDYEPVVQLIAPRRLQMLTLGADYMPNERTVVKIEGARSINDINTFSNINKGDDGGNAFRVGFSNLTTIGGNIWSIQTDANYEFTQDRFRFIERYRDVEFDRTWSRQLTNTIFNQDTGFTEHIVFSKLTLRHYKAGSIYYQFGFYDRQGAFNGIQHSVGTKVAHGNYLISADAERLNTITIPGAKRRLVNDMIGYNVDAGRNIRKIFAGLRLLSERSSFITTGDSLATGSFAFNQYGAYLRSNDSSRLEYRLEYNERDDYQPLFTEFNLTTKSRTASGNLSVLQKNNNRFSASTTYRELELRDSLLPNVQPERTILSRVEYDYAFLKRTFTANTYYQLGSGNELRRDFQFIEVPPGQGQYVWRDFNSDGLQTLNEFVPASAADRIQANYIRVFLPTTSTIRVSNNQFNQTLNINPATIWYNKTGMKKFIARWNNQSALRYDRRTSSLALIDFLNPFSVNIADSQIISNNSLFRNTLFFNRTDPTFGLDINYTNNSNKNFLTNGFDTRFREERGGNFRWNINTEWGITMSYTNGFRTFTSNFFTENNFRYTFDEWKPRLIWQASRQLRITGIITYFEGVAPASAGTAKGTNSEYGTEVRYSAAKNGVINARYSYYDVNFTGDISSPLGYDMMQGFVNGQNQWWTISFQQRIGNNIQLSANYDGRKSQGQNTIHVGRVEARYIF